MNAKRLRPSRPPHRWARALLAVLLVLVGFSTLMVRLELTQEGYQLSRVRAEIAELQENNRNLRLQTAELRSHQRLRGMAAKLGLEPPARGQVVVVP